MTYDQTDNPRDRLWQELEHVAREEERLGDGRSIRSVLHLREVIEGKKPVRRVLPDDGA